MNEWPRSNASASGGFYLACERDGAGLAMVPCKGKGTGELALFRESLNALEAGNVVIADGFHCTYWTLAMLKARGADVLTRQAVRRQ